MFLDPESRFALTLQELSHALPERDVHFPSDSPSHFLTVMMYYPCRLAQSGNSSDLTAV
jgi:hypothetical protein